MAVQHVYSQTVADGTATSVVRPSDWNSYHNQYLTISGNTAGQSTVSGTNVVLQGGNNVVLSANTAAGAATIIISGSNQSVQTQAAGNIVGSGISTAGANIGISGTLNSNGLSLSATVPVQTNQTLSYAVTGNTVGNSSGVSLDARSITLQGLGAASVGLSTSAGGSSVIVSVPSQTVQTQPAGNIVGSGFTSAGNNIGLSGTVNSNGVSISATVAAQTVQPVGSFGVSTGGNSVGTSGTVTNALVFAGGNNVTLSQATGAGGNTITISAAAQTVQTQSTAQINGSTGAISLNVGSSLSASTNGSSITFGLASNITTALQSAGAYLTTAAQSTQTLAISLSGNSGTTGSSNITAGGYALAGGSNITLSQSNNTISIIGPSQSASWGAVGNTTVSSSGSSAADIQYFSGAGNITVGLSSNTVIVSGAGGAGGVAVSMSGNTAGVAGIISSGTLNIAGGNNITVSQNGQSLTLSGANGGGAGMTTLGNTSGTTGLATNQLVFVGGNNITLSQSIDNGSATITISAVNTNNLQNHSSYIPFWPASTGSQTLGALGASSGSEFFWPISIMYPIVFDELRVIHSMSFVTSTAAGSQTLGSRWGIYTNNASTLSLISSGSLSVGVSNSSVSATFSYPKSSNSAGYTYNTTTASTTAQIHSLFGTVGAHAVGLNFGNTMSLSPGLYFLGLLQTASSTSNNVGISNAIIGNIMGIAQSVAPWGQATSAFSSGANASYDIAWGAYSASTTNVAAAVPISQMLHSVSQIPIMTFLSS